MENTNLIRTTRLTNLKTKNALKANEKPNEQGMKTQSSVNVKKATEKSRDKKTTEIKKQLTDRIKRSMEERRDKRSTEVNKLRPVMPKTGNAQPKKLPQPIKLPQPTKALTAAKEADRVRNYQRKLRLQLSRAVVAWRRCEAMFMKNTAPNNIQEAVLTGVRRSTELLSLMMKRFASMVESCSNPNGKNCVTVKELLQFWDSAIKQMNKKVELPSGIGVSHILFEEESRIEHVLNEMDVIAPRKKKRRAAPVNIEIMHEKDEGQGIPFYRAPSEEIYPALLKALATSTPKNLARIPEK